MLVKHQPIALEIQSSSYLCMKIDHLFDKSLDAGNTRDVEPLVYAASVWGSNTKFYYKSHNIGIIVCLNAYYIAVLERTGFLSLEWINQKIQMVSG